MQELAISGGKPIRKKMSIINPIICGSRSALLSENKILLLADSLETKEEINIERAKQAYDRAKDRLSNRGKDIDAIRAEGALARAINRLKFTGTSF